MKNLNEKLRKNSGFTLVEMLIVVAIIAILIAVSIPLVGSSLERAREATDQANERAAIGAAEARFLTSVGAATGSEYAIIWNNDTPKTATFYYKVDNASGELTQTAPTSAEGFDYGQGTAGAGEIKLDRAGCYIKITMNEDGTCEAEWDKYSAPATP